MAFYEKHLKDDEQLIRIVRRYWLTFIMPFSLSTFVILAAFFLLIPLFSSGGWEIAGFVVLLIFGIIISARNITVAYFNCFIITDRRVVDYDQKGLFDRTVSEATYNKIQDISYRIKGLLATTLNYGAVEIQTAGTQANLELKNVKNPRSVQQLIVDLQNQCEEERLNPNNDMTRLSAEELVGMIRKLKKGLGEDKFKEMIER